MTDTTAIEGAVAHRPWPLPDLPWVLYQSWRDLLFAHWRVAPEALRPLVPRQLELDLHDGSAWVGMTPFLLTDFRPRALPALPAVSEFPELNLRTYVRAGGKNGIYFFSLDAGSRLAVAGARTVFRLPYHYASMEIGRDRDEFRFRSRREDAPAQFEARYQPIGVAFEAEPGSVEHFLAERYALFVVTGRGAVLRTDIHHLPWRLQRAKARIEANTVAGAAGVPVDGEPDLLHFSARQDTLVWPPVR